MEKIPGISCNTPNRRYQWDPLTLQNLCYSQGLQYDPMINVVHEEKRPAFLILCTLSEKGDPGRILKAANWRVWEEKGHI